MTHVKVRQVKDQVGWDLRFLVTSEGQGAYVSLDQMRQGSGLTELFDSVTMTSAFAKILFLLMLTTFMTSMQ